MARAVALTPTAAPATGFARIVATTPARLRALVVASWAVLVVLCAIVTSSAGEHRDATTTIVVDAAPSVVAAHHLEIEIANLDADLVDEMLVPSADAKTWSTDFATNRVDIGRHLLAATRSAYGEDEDAPIEALQDTLGRYLMAAQAAIDAHRQGDPARAITDYRATLQIIDTEMVPAADRLNDISDAELELAYEHQVAHSRRVQILVGVVGGALVLLLLAMQLYVFRRFKRRISPGLVVATLLTLVFVGYTATAFRANAHALAGVKVDSYDSVDNLLATLAHAYEASAAKSRWLLDVDHRADHERRYQDQVGKITFPKRLVEAGESELATHTRAAYTDYLALDQRMRELERGGRHADAVAFALGDTNAAFVRFDTVLSRWSSIKEAALQRDGDTAFASVARLPVGAPVVALLIAIAIAFGLRPRLREYAGEQVPSGGAR